MIYFWAIELIDYSLSLSLFFQNLFSNWWPGALLVIFLNWTSNKGNEQLKRCPFFLLCDWEEYCLIILGRIRDENPCTLKTNFAPNSCKLACISTPNSETSIWKSLLNILCSTLTAMKKVLSPSSEKKISKNAWKKKNCISH